MAADEKTGILKSMFLALGRFFVKIITFGLFGKSNDEVKTNEEEQTSEFSAKEMKKLSAEIKAIPRKGPWLEIRGKKIPLPGHIFRIKENSRYSLVKPGSLVLVQVVEIFKLLWELEDMPAEAKCLILDSRGFLSNHNSWSVLIRDLEEVENENVYFANWKTPLREFSVFADGEAVETTEEIILTGQGQGRASVFKIPAGSKGVIDFPRIETGASLDDINSPHHRQKLGIRTGLIIYYYDAGPFGGTLFKELLTKDFFIPFSAQGDVYEVYIPSLSIMSFKIKRSQLRKRTFEPAIFDRVVMEDGLKDQILSLVQEDEADLKRWGVSKFQKGGGKNFLAYGPPGTGKTMTGEALAEWLGRPLYKVNSMDLGLHSGYFEANLKNVIDRTARWNSVTVIDEAESILRSRDLEAVDSNARITAVLRNLESLERGIIWFTTNRPFDIDFAIESRIRAMFYFKFPDAHRRRKIWEVTMPAELPIEGLNETILDEIAAVPLDGREIKNAIQNAAVMASGERLEKVPAEYLLKAAKQIQQSREIMAKARKEGRESSGKGPGQYL